jgi:hypothetical protein
MTIIIIALSVIAWVLLSAFFLIAACALSARLRQVNLAGDEQSASSWIPSEGEIPTRPVGSMS